MKRVNQDHVKIACRRGRRTGGGDIQPAPARWV